MSDAVGVRARLIRSRQLVAGRCQDSVAVLHQLDLCSRDLEALLDEWTLASDREAENKGCSFVMGGDPMDDVKSSVESPTWDDFEREEMRLHGRHLADD